MLKDSLKHFSLENLRHTPLRGWYMSAAFFAGLLLGQSGRFLLKRRESPILRVDGIAIGLKLDRIHNHTEASKLAGLPVNLIANDTCKLNAKPVRLHEIVGGYALSSDLMQGQDFLERLKQNHQDKLTIEDAQTKKRVPCGAAPPIIYGASE